MLRRSHWLPILLAVASHLFCICWAEGDCDALDSCNDKLGFESIRWLHHQLDDDANGNVDVAESDEFLRDELKYENGYDRHNAFHGNDKHISVDELWKSWKRSEVHNWTVDETVDWLVNSIELPQYREIFVSNNVDGTALPRLASNAPFLNSILGIKDPIHRQKISLKAMDVVLFGPPKHHNYVKDVILVLSLVLAIGGCWFAFVQHKYSQTHLKKMLKDMDSLQKAEEQLMELQKKLSEARHEQEMVFNEKEHLEQKLKSEVERERERDEGLRQRENSSANISDVSRIYELEEEVRETREQLNRAETALANKLWAPPQQLQSWLQLTHELEIRHYNNKRQSAEMQLGAAKDGCEKLRKKRSSFLGSFRVAHGSSIDDVDNRIIQAKSALSEVTKDLQERLHRWKQIETLCGFSIVHNHGLVHLETHLLGSSMFSSSSAPGLTRTSSEGTVQDSEEDGMGSRNGINNLPPYPAGSGSGINRLCPQPALSALSSAASSRTPSPTNASVSSTLNGSIPHSHSQSTATSAVASNAKSSVSNLSGLQLRSVGPQAGSDHASMMSLPAVSSSGSQSNRRNTQSMHTNYNYAGVGGGGGGEKRGGDVGLSNFDEDAYDSEYGEDINKERTATFIVGDQSSQNDVVSGGRGGCSSIHSTSSSSGSPSRRQLKLLTKGFSLDNPSYHPLYDKKPSRAAGQELLRLSESYPELKEMKHIPNKAELTKTVANEMWTSDSKASSLVETMPRTRTSGSLKETDDEGSGGDVKSLKSLSIRSTNGTLRYEEDTSSGRSEGTSTPSPDGSLRDKNMNKKPKEKKPFILFPSLRKRKGPAHVSS